MLRSAISIVLIWLQAMPDAYALMPFPKPDASDLVENGKAAPFAGSWSMTLPTMEMGEPDTQFATCARPVRIEQANDTHIFYLGPKDEEADAAVELTKLDGGTFWQPIAGGPTYFAFWVTADSFYLYDEVPEAEADWGLPYIYRRCP